MCIEINAEILSDLPDSWEADPWSQIQDCQESGLTVKYAVYVRSTICLVFLEPFFSTQ